MNRTQTVIDRCEKVLAGVHWLSIFISSTALVILVVTFGWLVFGRYVLNVTPTWVEQVALLLVWGQGPCRPNRKERGLWLWS